MSAALIGGAVPDLLIVAGDRYLLVVWIVAIAIGAVLWVLDYKRVGIAVLVSLPEIVGEDETEGIVRQIDRWMINKHRGWFRAGPEYPSIVNLPQARADWAIETIQHRLKELDPTADDATTVFLYLHCRQEEAFHLGRASDEVWRTDSSQRLSADGGHRRSIQLSLIVRYISTYADRKSGDYFEIDLSKKSKHAADQGLAEQMDLSDKWAKGTHPRRLALAVYASDERGSLDQFKSNVVSAVTGGSEHSYAVASGDDCDHALFISIPPAALVSSLKDGSAQQFISYIEREWRAYAEQAYGSPDVEVRVFVKGPALIAFAAGAILPRTSKLIAWNPQSQRSKDSKLVDAISEYLAIIDGDDVGVGMEQRLLSGDLDRAIEYSSSASERIERIVSSLQEIGGVDLVSSAGDSAIFRLSSTSIDKFRTRAQQLRTETDFRFSCGIGRDARAAYLSLRIAKTSGKNASQVDL
jgi:hypothetical protein